MLDPSVFVHPAALCESEEVGPRTRVWAFAHVLAGARVGADCNLCDGAFVEGGAVVGNRVTIKNNVLIFDGVTIEDDAFIGPNAVFTNDLRPRTRGMQASPWTLTPTTVRRGASIGANATIVCGVTIGAHALIGAGSVVLTDVADFAIVVGNPARVIGWGCSCGARLDDTLTCDCGRSYRLVDGARLSPQ
jgi:UDP-2-acetamido-3-amino-2,3-dideoxy-glucuronate N-acetyltransferase